MAKSWQVFYRPRKFSELHLQDVSENMTALAKSGKLAQVWLFTGPRGTGKTSTARIMAAMLATKANEAAVENNYLQKKTDHLLPLVDPDLEDKEVQNIFAGNSYSVVEMDAASHRGIDDVRQLQEQLAAPPPLTKMAVYILDEVHMFTTEAFNALLKTLEEPPAHCVFILATTEQQKVPPTVISRCSLLNFHRASEAELKKAFARILTAEKMEAEDQALVKIAQLADGSFRDGVKLLQTVANYGAITEENVIEHLTGDQTQLVRELVEIILTKNEVAAVDFFAKVRAQAWQEKFLINEFFEFLHAELVKGIKKEKPTVLSQAQAGFLLGELTDLRLGLTIPYLDLELKILQILEKAKKVSSKK